MAYFAHVESRKISLLAHVNMSICGSLLIGRCIIKWVFGELWPIESQHMYDRMLNFLLFKMIFIGAVMDPVWRHILRLSMWIGILGFMRIFSLLSRDRLDNLTTIAFVSIHKYYKIIILLSTILLSNIIWYLGSLYLFPTSLAFLTLEFLPVVLDTVQVLIKYITHLLDQWIENGFESKRWINYYTELSADVLILACTLLQYLQLMWMHGISFGLVDIVLFLNVRSVLKTLHNKITIYRERWRAMAYIRQRYVDASPEELSKLNDDCAICREKMKTATKLACGHLFHLQCLHSWIQHHVSKPTCPTCRRPLST
ncbi:uncharacterized protein RHIMIDRAFT_234637 [Rhizopus microsporus ATCC 52813]|nr:uncharacterized protein RHIMIDRAFT_234637 [Rhizopus microsporus ATCC 52813]KAG1173706.1 hypothetical protein G6F71_005459 [Rhizopus microsporus]PHZ15280.1 hypothetical protein RHIMIDRAFT_234637 [Rhizopus microsporus ATCC 52813]